LTHHENRTPIHSYSDAKGRNDSIREKLPAGVSAQELLTRPRVAKAEPFITALLCTCVCAGSPDPAPVWQSPQGKHSGGVLVSRLRMMWSVGETPQPAATGAHSTAGMGQSREETPSNSNFLAALRSGLEQAHEVRGGP
jgi:hypothetical protein